MAIEIHLIRHAETAANRDGLWQGQGDSPLSEGGARQADALGRRLRGREYDVVICSDLGRAVATARSFAHDPVLDPSWREADIGAWEGLTESEVAARFSDEIAALMAGEDTQMGGGESTAEFESRMDAAFDRLVAHAADGSRIAIVTHGGVIGGLTARVLGARRLRPRPVTRLSNTAISVIRVDGDHHELEVFNDASHRPAPRSPGVVLVRHGESEANVSGHWHGVTDGPLTDTGRRQAKLAAEMVDVDVVYSSALARARDTAAATAERYGHDHHVDSRLGEMDFGEWEDLTPSEIMDRYADEFSRTYRDREDLPRGGSGETHAQVRGRMDEAIRELVGANPGATVGVFSHGSAIRAYLSGVLGLEYAVKYRIASPVNTGISAVTFGEFGPQMSRFNNTPHLEG